MKASRYIFHLWTELLKQAFSVLDYENGRLIYIIWAPTADQLRQQLNTLRQIPLASESVTLVE